MRHVVVPVASASGVVGLFIFGFSSFCFDGVELLDPRRSHEVHSFSLLVTGGLSPYYLWFGGFGAPKWRHHHSFFFASGRWRGSYEGGERDRLIVGKDQEGSWIAVLVIT